MIKGTQIFAFMEISCCSRQHTINNNTVTIKRNVDVNIRYLLQQAITRKNSDKTTFPARNCGVVSSNSHSLFLL